METERLSQIAPDFEGKKSFKKLPAIFDLIGRMTWEDVGEDGEEKLITVLTVKSPVEHSHQDQVRQHARVDRQPVVRQDHGLGA